MKLFCFIQCQKLTASSFFRACIGLPPQNHMLLEHKLQRNFLPPQTMHINGYMTTLKKVALPNGNHISLTNGICAHADDVACAL